LLKSSLVLAVVAACALGCDTNRRAGDTSVARAPEAAPAERSVAAQPRALRASAPRAPDADCSARLERARAAGRALADLPQAARAALLAQVKATPVVFFEPPVPTSTDPVVRQWRSELTRSELPGRVLARLLRRFRQYPAFLREVILTDGYVYATEPALAVTLAEGVTPGALFRERRIVIERGSREMTAESDEHGGYRYVDGPERGKVARLVLFDRVFAAGAGVGPSRHADVEGLRDQLGFDELELERAAPDGIVARARYGELSVPTLLTRRGTTLERACEAPGPAAPALAAFRAARAERQRGIERIRAAILAGVDENLPFDEPRTEFGQQDGKLRQEWRQAYFQRASRYEFNGDTYRVFDSLGRPLVPEVCIDFVVDSLERAGGAWYARAGQAPAHAAGSIDFDATGMLNRRNVEEFLALARRRGDWFEFRAVPPEEQVPFKRRDRFFSVLYAHRAEYQPGDIVVILGERDDAKLHYHSFFVFDADPVTGMPTLVAANSGRPRVRAWAAEMASAPKRSVFARVRLRSPFLEQTAVTRPGGAPRPLTAKAEPLRSPASP
jgi:hypothetical protein